MKKWIKWMIGALIVVIIVALSILSKYKPFETDIITANNQTVASTVIEKGKLVSGDTLDIFSEIQGKITKINVETGDAVEVGNVLAKVDISDISAQIAQLQGELKAIKGMESASQTQINYNQVKQQEAVVEQAKIALAYAEDTNERLQNLFKEGAVTSAEVEQAKTDVESKQKIVAQAEAALAQFKADVAQQSTQKQGTKLQYQGQKESLLAKIEYLKDQQAKGNINAPEKGRILSKKIKNGDYVVPGTPLFTLGDVDKLIIETFVSSKDLINVNMQDKVNVIFKSAGKDVEVLGTITKIAPVAEEVISALGITEDKIKVNVELANPPDKINLIPGITADIEITTQKADNVVAVPKDVVFRDNAKDYVWVVNNNIAKIVEVQKGIEGDQLVEIKSGLNAGDKVILNPHQKELKEGIKIK